MPTILTYSGMSQIYLSGIAIKSKTKNEMASKVLIHLKIVTELFEFDMCFFRKNRLIRLF